MRARIALVTWKRTFAVRTVPISAEPVKTNGGKRMPRARVAFWAMDLYCPAFAPGGRFLRSVEVSNKSA